MIQAERAAADPANQLAIVSGHQDRGPSCIDLAEQVHDLERQIRVEIASGLISQDDDRIVDQRPRDGNPLLFASRQLHRVCVHAMLKADPFQDLKRAPLLL